MSEEKKLDSNKNILILGAVVALIVVVGAYLYNQQQKETVSINIGGKEISATFEK
ncbi:MAG: hypothetical protein H6867_07340 [Rhodospirillales bacterium]|nr:hypothetical protein [Rhodospirillales bacterium]MCB9995365.1 hypothetical protein [Rhodospirillales bacterium]